LTFLNLRDNQITDVSSLQKLTRLSTLNLQGNPLNQKICPVQSTSVCRF
ncbi:MAG: leucine-rich repeat domain-containing protein, partial [Xenococcus sp. (in: cyanobacteria)]